MTRLPQLERDLMAAAARRPRGPLAPRRLAPALAVAALAAIAIAAWPAGERERELAQRPAAEGLPPGYAASPPEEGHRYTRRPRLLAVGERQGERVFSVVGYHLAGPGGAGSLCLDVVLADGTASGCLSPSEHAQGTAGGLRTQNAVGATTQAVDAVEVTYGRSGRADAVLARAEDPEALRALELEPFTMYLAEIPGGARPRTAVARRDGRVVWRAEFPR